MRFFIGVPFFFPFLLSTGDTIPIIIVIVICVEIVAPILLQLSNLNYLIRVKIQPFPDLLLLLFSSLPPLLQLLHPRRKSGETRRRLNYQASQLTSLTSFSWINPPKTRNKVHNVHNAPNNFENSCIMLNAPYIHKPHNSFPGSQTSGSYPSSMAIALNFPVNYHGPGSKPVASGSLEVQGSYTSSL